MLITACTTRVTTEECTGEARSTNTIKNVGLIYPSDYVYTYANGVDNTCYENGYSCREKGRYDTDDFIPGVPISGWLFNSADQ